MCTTSRLLSSYRGYSGILSRFNEAGAGRYEYGGQAVLAATPDSDYQRLYEAVCGIDPFKK